MPENLEKEAYNNIMVSFLDEMKKGDSDKVL